jgi:flagellar basal body-associated protein FliL
LNQKILIAIIVIVAVSIAGTVVLNAFMPKDTILVPTQTEASIKSEVGGHYEGESGLYYIEGTLENTGKKDAKNVTFDIILFKLSTSANDEEIKRETVNIGDILAETSKDVNFTVSLPKDLGEVRGQWDVTWD